MIQKGRKVFKKISHYISSHNLALLPIRPRFYFLLSPRVEFIWLILTHGDFFCLRAFTYVNAFHLEESVN